VIPEGQKGCRLFWWCEFDEIEKELRYAENIPASFADQKSKMETLDVDGVGILQKQIDKMIINQMRKVSQDAYEYSLYLIGSASGQLGMGDSGFSNSPFLAFAEVKQIKSWLDQGHAAKNAMEEYIAEDGKYKRLVRRLVGMVTWREFLRTLAKFPKTKKLSKGILSMQYVCKFDSICKFEVRFSMQCTIRFA
jgi:hypothetical protein